MNKRIILRALTLVVFGLVTPMNAMARDTTSQALVTTPRVAVALELDADHFIVGQFQDWVISVHDAAGKAVYPARIGLAGGMVAHGHGMPTQPLVTDYLGAGRYRVEGMKFNMAGTWGFVINIDAANLRERVTLDLLLDY